MCVGEKEREREIERELDREREIERERCIERGVNSTLPMANTNIRKG